MNTNNNKLDSLLKKEKNITETPLFSENEIRNILGEKRAVSKPKISRINFLIGVFSMVALTSIGAIVAIVLNLTGMPQSEDETGKSTKSLRSPKDTVIIHFVDKPERKGNIITNQNPEFKGIHLMELTDEELAKIGVLKEARGITYYMKSKESMNISSIGVGRSDTATATKITVSMDGLVMYPGREDVVKKSLLQFNPRVVTDDQGMRRLFRFDEEEVAPSIARTMKKDIEVRTQGKNYNKAKMKEYDSKITAIAEQKFGNVNNLIPILIHTGKIYTAEDKKKERWRPDCIFWYDATPEFIAALPDRFKKQISFEQKAVEVLAEKTENAIEKVAAMPSPQQVLIDVRKDQKIETQEILIPEKEKRETGDSYFDVWRSTAGAIISTQIFPNPIRDQRTTVIFSLKEIRNIAITLHDIYGRRIAELSQIMPFKSGEYTQEIVLKGVQPGIYLIAIQTDKGEQAVQRVIVE